MPYAIEYTEFGAPEVLKAVEIAPVGPAPGEVLVETRAIGVNPGEVKRRAGGRWKTPPVFPVRPGSDASGVVIAVGEGVDGWEPGDEVIGRGLKGAYSSHVIASPSQLLPKPTGLGFEAATLVGTPAGTAYQVLRSTPVGPGDVLLVHGGAGGVGQSAIQFARHLGATVVATARPERHGHLRALGAIPVAYGPGLLDRVREAAPQGVTAAFDTAGTDEAFEVSIALLPLDRIVTVGAVDAAARWGVRSYTGDELTPDEAGLRRAAAPLALELWARGEFTFEVGAAYPLREAAAAHAHSESRNVVGKIVLIP